MFLLPRQGFAPIAVGGVSRPRLRAPEVPTAVRSITKSASETPPTIRCGHSTATMSSAGCASFGAPDCLRLANIARVYRIVAPLQRIAALEPALYIGLHSSIVLGRHMQCLALK